MTHLSSVLVFLLGSTLSAWLRFDRGALLVSVVVMLVSLTGVVGTWLLEARRAPPLVWPRAVNELGSRGHLTPDEERRFAAALREDNVERQMEAWRRIQRQGPASLVLPRAAFYYFWLCVFVLVLVPQRAVPGHVLPWVPRFVLVLTTLALAALAIAAPFGVRDWKRVVRSLDPDDGGEGRR